MKISSGGYQVPVSGGSASVRTKEIIARQNCKLVVCNTKNWSKLKINKIAPELVSSFQMSMIVNKITKDMCRKKRFHFNFNKSKKCK